MFIVNGCSMFIWNTSGRHGDLRPHLDAAGAGLVVTLDQLLVIREALDGEQRGPREGPLDPRLQVEHLVEADDAAGEQRDDAAVGFAQRLEQRRELGEVGDA